MDEIIGALVREAGKQYAEAQKRTTAEAAQRGPQPQRRLAPQGKTAAPTVASILAPPPEPPAPPAPPPRPAQPVLAVPAPETLGFDGLDAPALPGVPVVKSDLHLLKAFQSTSGLLAGIVLSEALAPPVALRGSQLFDRIER